MLSILGITLQAFVDHAFLTCGSELLIALFNFLTSFILITSLKKLSLSTYRFVVCPAEIVHTRKCPAPIKRGQITAGFVYLLHSVLHSVGSSVRGCQRRTVRELSYYTSTRPGRSHEGSSISVVFCGYSKAGCLFTLRGSPRLCIIVGR